MPKSPTIMKITELHNLLLELKAKGWRWGSNIDCKYVNVMIDMRDLSVANLTDRHGNKITVEDLVKQSY